MPLLRLKKATPGNIVLIDFSSKHEVGKSSEKRVSPLRQIVGIWVITTIIRFNILSQNLEKDIQKYFVITQQLKLENIEPAESLALVSASMPT